MFEGFSSSAGIWIAENTPIVASVFGSTVSLKFTGLKTWREKTFAVFSGAACAKYLAPLVDQFLHIGEETAGFLIGVFGLSLCAAILEAIRKFGANADFWELIRNYVLGKQSANKTAAAPEDTKGSD